jgi:hypothetical protein
MKSLREYQQWLATLKSLPASDADALLKQALLRGTRDGGFTLMRADIWHYYEQVHHYYGCPEDKPCDKYNLAEPLEWEKVLLELSDHVEHDAPKLETNIMEDWLVLVRIGHYYEALIRERWIKMTVHQRKELLLKIHPKLPLHHRPDIDDSIIKACPHQRHSERLSPYALPHLNLEDLTLPNSMLLLFHARTHFPPSTFSLSDYELARMYRLRPALLESTRQSMDVTDRYGLLLQWATEADALNSMNKGETVHPRIGIHILTLHYMLIDFLRKFTIGMLADKGNDPMPKLSDTTFKILPPPSSDGDEYSALGTVIREAPYRVPQHMDLSRLRTLVSARTNAAEDHIWLLREDPSYFAEVVFELREHRPELLKGRDCGKAHANGKDDILWARVLRNVAVDGYIELSVWRKIRDDITHLERLSKEHTKDIRLNQDLPRDYFDTLTKTWFFLEAFQLDLIQQLKTGFSASPDVRARFTQVCKHTIAAEDDFVDAKFTNDFKKKPDPEVRRALTLFGYLWEAPKRHTLGVHAIVEVLEHMLQNNPRAKVMTSAWVVSCLSQLSIVTECLRQLNCFQPWATKIKIAVKERQTELLVDHMSDLAKWYPVLHTSFRDTGLVVLGKPGIKFRYPINKRRTRTNVETLRTAEASLDAFWKAADNEFLRQAGTMPSELVEGITGERTLQRTPPWKEPDQAGASPEEVEYLYIPIPNSLHDPTKQITGNFDKLAITTNEKLKRHGIVGQETQTQQDNAASDTTEDSQPVFELDQRAHKVFRTLFHSPLSRNQPEDTPWSDFLHAMASTGFSIQKLQGSAWQFTPRGLDVEQPIQFHEPHPTHRLPFTWARRNGRRLARTYGWRGDMFRLA